jgi:phage protein D
MITETIRIEIDGEEVTDTYADLASVEVELDDELPSMFRLRFPLLRRADGTWTYIDDERLRTWAKVGIDVALDGGFEQLITGYVTHVKPAFDPDPTKCVLDVWGLDRSVLLDREDRLMTWPNKKDSDIATDLFSHYGFSSDVQDTEVVHDEAVSTIVQRETDWQFLNRLAKRNGFACWVEGNMGHFEKPRLDRRPQAVLAVQFGDETNVDRFSLEVNALTPANVALYQIERNTKTIVTATVDSSDERQLGKVGAVPARGIVQGLVVLGQTASTGAPEMVGLCTATFEQQKWFVTGRGEIAANKLGVVLRPRGTATVKGVGETYSGTYLVTHVTHAFSYDGYIQRFEVKRNALLPTGSEDFDGSGAGVLGGVI